MSPAQQILDYRKETDENQKQIRKMVMESYRDIATGKRRKMKYLLKTVVWIVLISLGLLLGPPLLTGFVWWKVLAFGIACNLIGDTAYKLFRAIDRL